MASNVPLVVGAVAGVFILLIIIIIVVILVKKRCGYVCCLLGFVFLPIFLLAITFKNK